MNQLFNPDLYPLYVVISVDGNALKPYAPAENWIGTTLLAKVIDQAFEKADLLLSPSIWLGPLNECIIASNVKNVHECARLVQALAQAACLTGALKIYRVDKAEQIARCIFPGTGDMVDHAWFLDLLQTAISKQLKVLDKMTANRA